MNKYRIDKQRLLNTIRGWDSFLKKKIHLIACGGTALTLLGIKASTKDIDLIVPDLSEYKYLISNLEKLGYKPVTGLGWSRDDGFIFDFFKGKIIHTTELLESPLDNKNHILAEELDRVYLGILNYYDLVISKLFRGTNVDFGDCFLLIKAKRKEIDLKLLKERFRETASFDVSTKVGKRDCIKNFESLIK